MSDRVSLFCRDYLFPRFKFLSDDWQKYDAENENSLSYFVGKRMKMNSMNTYEDLWERVFVPTMHLKYQTLCCNLNNAIKQIYKGESLNWEGLLDGWLDGSSLGLLDGISLGLLDGLLNGS